MAFPVRMKGGPATYEALSAVTASQIVEYVAGTTIDPSLAGCQPAGDNSAKVLGWATKDAVPTASQAAASSTTTSYAGSYPGIDTSVPTATVAVESCDVWVKCTNSGAALNFRDPIVAGANGTVRKAAAGENVIGWCAQPGGIGATTGVGLCKISV